MCMAAGLALSLFCKYPADARGRKHGAATMKDRMNTRKTGGRNRGIRTAISDPGGEKSIGDFSLPRIGAPPVF